MTKTRKLECPQGEKALTLHSNDIEMQDLPDYGTPNETLPVNAAGSSTMGPSSPGTNATNARLKYIEDFPSDAGTPGAFKKMTFE